MLVPILRRRRFYCFWPISLPLLSLACPDCFHGMFGSADFSGGREGGVKSIVGPSRKPGAYVKLGS